MSSEYNTRARARVCVCAQRTALTAGSLWFNLAMLFNHFWTITKLIFVYNNEAGHEHLKKEGYGNVPPDELEAQIQETIGIIKKLMTENIHGAIETLAKNLSAGTVSSNSRHPTFGPLVHSFVYPLVHSFVQLVTQQL